MSDDQGQICLAPLDGPDDCVTVVLSSATSTTTTATVHRLLPWCSASRGDARFIRDVFVDDEFIAARDRPFSLSAIARSADRAGARLPDRAGSSAAIGEERRGSSADPHRT